MQFLPLTRQAQLDFSDPTGIVVAAPNTQFYRSGNDLFYLIDQKGVRTPILVSKKGFALPYKNQAWFNTITDDLIVFTNPYELWIKRGTTTDAYNWTYLSNLPVSL
jgi:hypothetical protein